MGTVEGLFYAHFFKQFFYYLVHSF